MIEKLYGNIPSYDKSYSTEKVDEMYHSMVKKSLDVTIDVIDEYIKFWADEGVQEFYYELGDCLETEEIVDLLNCLNDENERLKKRNEFLKRRCDEYWEESGLNTDYFE